MPQVPSLFIKHRISRDSWLYLLSCLNAFCFFVPSCLYVTFRMIYLVLVAFTNPCALRVFWALVPLGVPEFESLCERFLARKNLDYQYSKNIIWKPCYYDSITSTEFFTLFRKNIYLYSYTRFTEWFINTEWLIITVDH